MSGRPATTTAPHGRLVLGESVGIGDAGALYACCADLLGRDGPVTVDCAATTYIDTAGMQLLAALHRALSDKGRAMVLEGVGDELRGWLRLARLDELRIDDARNGSGTR